MTRFVTRRRLVVLVLVGVVASLIVLALPTPTAALPDYTTKTGAACTVCHANPTGGPLTARGQSFAAVANHAADPAGAFAASGAAAPAPTAPPAPTPTRAPASPPPTAPPTAVASPTATAGGGATTLPRTGFPSPLLPAALMSAMAVLAGIYLRRR